jgi:hypothetical protein
VDPLPELPAASRSLDLDGGGRLPAVRDLEPR